MIRTVAAFSAGVVVGWVGRGVIGSERELLVRTIGFAHLVRERVTRIAAEQVEWWQDLVAEAKARVNINRAAAQPDVDAPAKVVRVA
jgi:hypothetical protein